jgi:hypothetical protein
MLLINSVFHRFSYICFKALKISFQIENNVTRCIKHQRYSAVLVNERLIWVVYQYADEITQRLVYDGKSSSRTTLWVSAPRK